MVRTGDVAPDFEALAADGSVIRLSDFRGRKNVLLYFYPADDTPGCTRQACDLRDAFPEYERANTVVLGVSTDDMDSHQEFIEKYDLNFPLLVDSDRKLCSMFGVPCQTAARRMSFLIDTNGRIARVWEHVDVATHSADVLQAIGELGHS